RSYYHKQRPLLARPSSLEPSLMRRQFSHLIAVKLRSAEWYRSRKRSRIEKAPLRFHAPFLEWDRMLFDVVVDRCLIGADVVILLRDLDPIFFPDFGIFLKQNSLSVLLFSFLFVVPQKG